RPVTGRRRVAWRGGSPRLTREGTRGVAYSWLSAIPDRMSGRRTSRQGHRAVTQLSEALSRVAAMVVFSNHRLGPSAELLVSREAAVQLLREVAEAAGPSAEAR